MTRPRGETHKRKRPGGELERAVCDLDQLIAVVLAAGGDEARRVLEATPGVDVRQWVLTEAVRRARVLLVESGGDRLKAYDALMRERRRWQ
jgi:hypothetical protein